MMASKSSKYGAHAAVAHVKMIIKDEDGFSADLAENRKFVRKKGQNRIEVFTSDRAPPTSYTRQSWLTIFPVFS